MRMQSALRLIYPPACISCDANLEQEFSLCGNCWVDTPFISGLICDTCGVPLPGETDGKAAYCDDCLVIARPWDKGRAALLYAGNGRRLVLALKHGDRQELALPAAGWMAKQANGLVGANAVVIPVPSHWKRLLKRHYNQAGLLAKEVAKIYRLEYLPDALVRHNQTKIQDGMGRDARFANMENAIQPHPKCGVSLSGKEVLIIDDVMTSGATFAATTDACFAAGASRVCVLALARVAKNS